MVFDRVKCLCSFHGYIYAKCDTGLDYSVVRTILDCTMDVKSYSLDYTEERQLWHVVGSIPVNVFDLHE